MDYHAKEVKEIFKELKTFEKGLTQEQAKIRLAKTGLNEISKKKKTSQILTFLKQFNSPLIYILFVAMIISFIFDHIIDAYVILVVVLINAIIGSERCFFFWICIKLYKSAMESFPPDRATTILS